ncbi:hypothetical protein [Zavarzinella formosa]|uniref:hypothetical protein n=1 Tax=Zavarzinella formosa TaxID=360055 RepID=UPI0002F2872D|nr:hypothetical protein [Zavarzinella formosa]
MTRESKLTAIRKKLGTTRVSLPQLLRTFAAKTGIKAEDASQLLRTGYPGVGGPLRWDFAADDLADQSDESVDSIERIVA